MLHCEKITLSLSLTFHYLPLRRWPYRLKDGSPQNLSVSRMLQPVNVVHCRVCESTGVKVRGRESFTDKTYRSSVIFTD